MTPVLHLHGQTTHARTGATAHAFRYRVDFILAEPEARAPAPWLFSRNRANLAGLHDRDHGGAPGQGRGAAWVRQVLAAQGLPQPTRLRLLAQPRLFGRVFNPVSLWFCESATGLYAVIAEVTNTWGDRHSYLCHRPDLGPITPADELCASKVLHVSPFQDCAGTYRFRFALAPDAVAIRIVHEGPKGGLVATLTGRLAPLTSAGILGACLARPIGALRVLGLIHWQALRLWAKGVPFRPRPAPPDHEVST